MHVNEEVEEFELGCIAAVYSRQLLMAAVCGLMASNLKFLQETLSYVFVYETSKVPILLAVNQRFLVFCWLSRNNRRSFILVHGFLENTL